MENNLARKSLARSARAFIRFSRPHTIIATSLQVIGLFMLAGGGRATGSSGWLALAMALISSLAVNIYIVGLNQLADVEVDRINKPYLPLASGEFSMSQGRWLVALMGLLALGLAASQGIYLFLTIGLSLLIGTVYSLPPLHLKSRPLGAALSIAFVRGFVANVGHSLYFHQALSPDTAVPWLLIGALAAFFFGFGLVIALYKDIPDLTGDKTYGIRTFTVRLGPKRVFNAGRWILTGFFLVPIVIALSRFPQADAIVLLVTQLAILILFWRVSLGVEPAEPKSITRFYMFLWGLFYAEYILLGLGAIIGSW
jgi:homogentisate phytyltransferase/homogentisate geranylgeranyltransferase